LHHLCEGGYTCDFHRALATRQFSKKSHHHRKQKIARVAAALCERAQIPTARIISAHAVTKL